MRKYFMRIRTVVIFLLLGCIFEINQQAFAGTIFKTNVRVDDTGSLISTQEDPAIAADTSGNIYVVWEDERNGNFDIYFAKSTDGGIFFEPNVRVDDTGFTTSIQEAPAIAVNVDGNIYVVWCDHRNGNNNIYFAKSTDGGISFEPDVRVDDDLLTYTKKNPAIAVDTSGNIYVVWSDGRNGWSIYSAKSTDGGISFESNIRVNDSGPSMYPSIAADAKGNIYVVWSDSGNSNADIYFAKSTNGGISFEPNVRVDDTGSSTSRQTNPSITVNSESHIYITWMDDRNVYSDIYFATSTDGGISFEPNVRVEDTVSSVSYQGFPSVTVGANSNICITWFDDRNGSFDIYFAKSTDGGISFEPNVRVDDTGSLANSQVHPSIAAGIDGNIHVAWADRRNSNKDIYFAKGKGAIPATIDITPDTINLKSQGRNITCYIKLLAEYDVHDIDIYSVTIESEGFSVQAEILPADVGDFDGDEIPDLMIKFNRDAVNGILSVGDVELTVKGSLIGGPNFEGSDIVKVKAQKK